MAISVGMSQSHKCARERFADVRFVELLDIHNRSVILSAEPLAAVPFSGGGL